jgi:hypothetical protein
MQGEWPCGRTATGNGAANANGAIYTNVAIDVKGIVNKSISVPIR